MASWRAADQPRKIFLFSFPVEGLFLQYIFKKSDFSSKISAKLLFFQNPKKKKYGDFLANIFVDGTAANYFRGHKLEDVLFSHSTVQDNKELICSCHLSLFKLICCCHSFCKLTKSSYESVIRRPAHQARVITEHYLSSRYPKNRSQECARVWSPHSWMAIYLIRCELELFIKHGCYSAQEGTGSQEVTAYNSN